MIGQLSGTITIVNKIEGSVIIMCNSGVGYAVFVGTNFALNLNCNQPISLFTETVVKEDSITLYGFETYEKQVWFKSFLKVSGVGTKMAMNIVDCFAPESIINALVNQNPLFFQCVSGLGEKVSQRIISELKKEPQKNTKILGGSIIQNGQMPKFTQFETPTKTTETKTKETKSKKTAENKPNTNINDVISALTNLGFDYNKAYNAAKLGVENSQSLEEAIVFALKKINEN